MSTPPREPSEEELRAAYEAELKRIKVADVVVQASVSLVNLAGRRLGLAPGSEDERDLEQARDAIDAVRALMPVLERREVAEAKPVREALAQLQLAYAQLRDAAGAAPQPAAPDAAGAPPGPAGDGDGAPRPKSDGAPQTAAQRPAAEQEPGPGPAESSGRLWVPGR